MRNADTLGEAIRALRIHRKLTQDELSRLACVERAHLSRIEGGKATPRLATLDRIAKALRSTSSRMLAA
jgi:transcriptional regulator with XRE-family HTH domain